MPLSIFVGLHTPFGLPDTARSNNPLNDGHLNAYTILFTARNSAGDYPIKTTEKEGVYPTFIECYV